MKITCTADEFVSVLQNAQKIPDAKEVKLRLATAADVAQAITGNPNMDALTQVRYEMIARQLNTILRKE